MMLKYKFTYLEWYMVTHMYQMYISDLIMDSELVHAFSVFTLWPYENGILFYVYRSNNFSSLSREIISRPL